MFILDTDHFSLLEWGSGAIGQRLHERIRSLPENEGNGIASIRQSRSDD